MGGLNIESIIVHVLTILGSGLAAHIAMEKRIAVNTEAIKNLRADLEEVEAEQDAWRASSQLLAVAINDLGHYSERLRNIESKVDNIRERLR